MKFNTGNPNLVGFTRFLSGDPSSAPNSLFSAQEVKDAWNLAYEEAWGIAKQLDVGWGRKDVYRNTKTGEIYYTIPSDREGRIVDVAVEATGLDLSSNTSAVFKYLEPSEPSMSLRGYNEGTFTSTRFYFEQGGKLGIVAPPTTGGVNSLLITYEAELAYLVNDAEEPLIPKGHQKLPCYLAAITLRVGKDLPVDDLRVEVARMYPQFMTLMAEPIQDLEFQAPAVGRSNPSFATKHGYMVRS